MALIEKFKPGPRKAKKPQDLLPLLNNALDAMEQEYAPSGSGVLDLCFLFSEGIIEPEWLDEYDPELANFYREWVEQNRDRIKAVFGKKYVSFHSTHSVRILNLKK